MLIKNTILLLTLFVSTGIKADKANESVFQPAVLMVLAADELSGLPQLSDKRPSPLMEYLKKQKRKSKKAVAAALAFPFPFGIVGLHRIYLGSAPYVPVVYIGTFGGAFGILPFIDFCILVFDKNIDPYINNSKVFMWVE